MRRKNVSRLTWFVGLWLASVAGLGLLAGIIRLAIG